MTCLTYRENGFPPLKIFCQLIIMLFFYFRKEKESLKSLVWIYENNYGKTKEGSFSAHFMRRIALLKSPWNVSFLYPMFLFLLLFPLPLLLHNQCCCFLSLFGQSIMFLILSMPSRHNFRSFFNAPVIFFLHYLDVDNGQSDIMFFTHIRNQCVLPHEKLKKLL